MVGYPKHLNSKADYEYVRTHFDRTYWEKDFQDLLDSVNHWVPTKELTRRQVGITDDTHKVIEIPASQSEDGKLHKTQFELVENPTCKLYRIGYTKEEVQNILNNE